MGTFGGQRASTLIISSFLALSLFFSPAVVMSAEPENEEVSPESKKWAIPSYYVATWQSHQTDLDAHPNDSFACAGGMYASYGLGLALIVTRTTLWCISPGYGQLDSK